MELSSAEAVSCFSEGKLASPNPCPSSWSEGQSGEGSEKSMYQAVRTCFQGRLFSLLGSVIRNLNYLPRKAIFAYAGHLLLT